MATAPGAEDLGACHAEAAVSVLEDSAVGPGPVEAGPARPGLELGLGVEELGAAPGAAEHALAVDVEQVAGPGGLGAGAAQDDVALPGKLGPPLFVGPGDFECDLLPGGLAPEHWKPPLPASTTGRARRYFPGAPGG